MLKKMVLLLALCASFPLTAQDSRVGEWARLFYVDAKLSQQYLNGIASFIYYLMEEQPSEKRFNEEFEKVGQAFTGAPKYFQQSLTRLYSNAYTQAYKTSTNETEPNEVAWKDALMNYYRAVYHLLDASHTTVGYGSSKGEELPLPH